MDIGVFIFATDYTIRMDELAPALEERGFNALFVPEHTHIPASRKTPWPGGGDLPRDYWSTYDPFVALSFAAMASTKLKLGTGICLVPQRDHFATAKSIASLDRLSGGRFIFGMGGGWNVEEMENHGVVHKTRFKQLREQVLAMKELWTKEEAEFHGDFVNFDPVWADPKPIQKPHPPIILGGETIHTMKRVVEFCDGWFPRPRGGFDVPEGIAKLREVADDAGRDFSELTITAFGAKPDAQTLEGYEQAGVTNALIGLASRSRDEVLQKLDEHAKLIA